MLLDPMNMLTDKVGRVCVFERRCKLYIEYKICVTMKIRNGQENVLKYYFPKLMCISSCILDIICVA